MDTRRPDGAPLATCSSWIYDPAATHRPRGFSTATVLVYPGLVLVEPRNLPRRLPRAWGRVPAVRYAWPAIVIQRLVWSYRADFPGVPMILLDLDGELGSATVSFGWRDRVAATFREAGFDVVEDVVRGWEAPHPLERRDHPELLGRVPGVVLADRRWWTDKPLVTPGDDIA